MSLPPSLAGISPADAARELLRRRQARTSLEAFTTYTMADYQVGWHHRLLCRYLDRFVAGEIRRLVVSMPAQHGKSELISRRLPAHLLGRDPDTRVIACSYGAALASDMNTDVQKIMDDDPYRRLFPAASLSAKGATAKRNSEVFEIVGRRGSYRCAGVGGPITGKPMDFGVIDDPIKNRAEADSPTTREAVWRWYTSTFLSRAHKDTRILIVMTRWHPEDLVGRLLTLQADDPKADKWEVLTLQAEATETRHPDDPRQIGEPLWPERHPKEELDQRKAASSTDWYSMYQQMPRAEGTMEWPDDYFGRDLWFEDWPINLPLRVMSLDPSKSRTDKVGDYSAYILLALDKFGCLWVDADLARRDATKVVNDGISLFKSFGPSAFAVETNQFLQLFANLLFAEAKAQKLQLPLYGIDNSVPKPVRIRTLGPLLAQKQIRIRSTPGGKLLVKQLREFPIADHDDGPDALEMGVRMLHHLLGERTTASQPVLLRG